MAACIFGMKNNTEYITDWMKTFLDEQGTWPVKACSVNEVSSLISKACLGRGLPNGHAFEMASLASALMSDQVLMGFFVGALYETLDEPIISLDNKTLTIDHARFILSGPMAIDALISGVETVVLRDMAWKRLITPLLVNAENTYKCFFSFEKSMLKTCCSQRFVQFDLFYCLVVCLLCFNFRALCLGMMGCFPNVCFTQIPC